MALCVVSNSRIYIYLKKLHKTKPYDKLPSRLLFNIYNPDSLTVPYITFCRLTMVRSLSHLLRPWSRLTSNKMCYLIDDT